MASAIVTNQFFREAGVLRREFDERQGDVRSTRRDRFVWDYWHVPGQYTQLRTPAWEYFSPAVYRRFHEHLVQWGRRTLGCHDVSPPWLSLYLDGCEQQLHGDLPHGPFAFVYSLSRGPFRGGETLILRDETLDYWRDFSSERSIEEPELVRAIAPTFNRLVCFDPKLPHGVRRVEGPRDPRHGRLVIHGWFVKPRPFVEGPVSLRAVASRIATLQALVAQSEALLAGVLAYCVRISAAGTVTRVDCLADTARVPATGEGAKRALTRGLTTAMRSWTFPKAKAASKLTLPLVFERQ